MCPYWDGHLVQIWICLPYLSHLCWNLAVGLARCDSTSHTASTQGLPSGRSAATGRCPRVSLALSDSRRPETQNHSKLNNGVMKTRLRRQRGDLS